MRAYVGLATLLCVAGGVGGWLYGQRLGLDASTLWPMLLALLLESILYLGVGFDEVRQSWPEWALGLTAVFPYLIYTVPLGLFSPYVAAALLIIGCLVAFWFRLIPQRWPADLLLLALWTAIYISRVFKLAYPSLHERVPMDILGHLMWVRITVVTLLNGRAPSGINFSFRPTAREWGLGILYFVLFLPAGYWLITTMNYAQFGLSKGWWYKAPINFAGGFLLVAASEEIFVRGVVQQRLAQWLGSIGGWIAASAVFGLVHLPYRHFPNWQHVALTFVLALFLGRAFLHGKGVRAPIIAHSLTIAAWRSFVV
jgi:membrane protease YdiL (CAAX protease family)